MVNVKYYTDNANDPWGLKRTGVDKDRAKIILNVFKNSRTVLDVGGGFGFYTKLIAENNKLCICIDISKRMVSEGKKINKDADFVISDAGFLPVKNCSFDGVLMMGTLIYIKDKRNVLKEIFRVLNDEGVLCIIDRNRNSPAHRIIRFIRKNEQSVDKTKNFLSINETKRLLADSNFEVKQISGDIIEFPLLMKFALFRNILSCLAKILPEISTFIIIVAEKKAL